MLEVFLDNFKSLLATPKFHELVDLREDLPRFVTFGPKIRQFFLFIFGRGRRLLNGNVWRVVCFHLGLLSPLCFFGGLRASGSPSWFRRFLRSSRQFCLFCFRRTPGRLLWRFWFSNWFGGLLIGL